MPDDDDWSLLLDDLYASVINAPSSSRLPDRLSRIFDGGSASLWTFDPRSGALTASPLTNMPAEALASYAAHYHAMDPWTVPLARSAPDVVVRGAELIDDASLARSAFYNDFAAQADMFHVIGSVVTLGDGASNSLGAVAVQRPQSLGAFGQPQVDRLTALLPHVRRAMQLRASVATFGKTVQTDTMQAMLASIGVAAVVADGHGMVLLANSAAERMDAAGIGVTLRGSHPGRLVAIGSARETKRLHDALADAARGGPGDDFALQASPGHQVWATVSRLPRHISTLPAAQPYWALLLIRSEGTAALPDLVSGAITRFGLTRAEAESAAALSAGASPAEIAAARSVRISTVRTLLKRAQAKTGANNLRDLVRLFALLRV